jgi:hypothetical protein
MLVMGTVSSRSMATVGATMVSLTQINCNDQIKMDCQADSFVATSMRMFARITFSGDYPFLLQTPSVLYQWCKPTLHILVWFLATLLPLLIPNPVFLLLVKL